LKAAAEAADRAVDTIDPSGSPSVHDLALYQATVLEARLTGRRTAGLRSAERLAGQREKGRTASLAATRAAIASERLRNERDLLARHAYADPLTGLANRRGFDRQVAGLQASGAEQVAVLLFDVDHFKQVNDRFGHAAGDIVLRRVSDVLTANVRSGDFAARVGGDEFMLLLADSGFTAATRRSEAIANEMAAQDWRDVDTGLRVTVSVGVAAGHPALVDTLARKADDALYVAKAARAQLAPSG
jgi:diguanylate cyclase (GGDEF)-like protein